MAVHTSKCPQLEAYFYHNDQWHSVCLLCGRDIEIAPPRTPDAIDIDAAAAYAEYLNGHYANAEAAFLKAENDADEIKRKITYAWFALCAHYGLHFEYQNINSFEPRFTRPLPDRNLEPLLKTTMLPTLLEYTDEPALKPILDKIQTRLADSVPPKDEFEKVQTKPKQPEETHTDPPKPHRPSLLIWVVFLLLGATAVWLIVTQTAEKPNTKKITASSSITAQRSEWPCNIQTTSVSALYSQPDRTSKVVYYLFSGGKAFTALQAIDGPQGEQWYEIEYGDDIVYIPANTAERIQ